MRQNLAFLSAASNAIPKPGGLLKWKELLVKDTRFSLPLTEAMKIARITSPLLDAPRQSLPKPMLRHGRELALISRPNLTLNLCTLFFALSLTVLPHLPPLLTSTTVPSPRESASVYAAYLRSHFFVSQSKTLRSRARGYLSELRQTSALRRLTRLFALLSIPLNFLRLPLTFSRPLPLPQT